MISLFQIAPNDQSIYYLSKVFGVVGDLLPSGSPTLLLGIMFKTLNTMVLTIGAFIVVYVTVVGLIKTAQEGEFLGKQWNSVWVPLRTVFGIAALFPMSSGYCAIQVIFMWVIVQGIGAADALWSTTLKATSVLGSPTASVSLPTTVSVGVNMEYLFNALVCQANARVGAQGAQDGRTDVPGTFGTSRHTIQFYCAQKSYAGSDFCQQSDESMLNPIDNTGNKNTYDMGPKGACGTLTYCSLNSNGTPDPIKYITSDYPSGYDNPAYTNAVTAYKDTTFCKAQRQALSTLIPVLGAVAKQFVDYDYDTLKLFNKDNYNGSTLKSDFPAWLQNYCSDNALSNCCIKDSPADTAPNSCGIDVQMLDSGTSPTLTNAYAVYQDKSSLNSNAVVNQLHFSGLRAYLGDPNFNFINTAVSQYASAMLAAQSTYISDIISKQNLANLTDWQKQAANVGWIQAGSFLFKIANQTGGDVQAISDYFSDGATGKFKMTQKTSPDSPLSNYRNNMGTSQKLISLIFAYVQSTGNTSPAAGGSTGQGGSGSSTSVPGLSNISDIITGSSGTIVSDFIQNLSGQSGYSNSGVNQNGVYGAVYNPIMNTSKAVAIGAGGAAVVGLGVGAAAGAAAVGTGLGGVAGAAGGAAYAGITAFNNQSYAAYSGTTNPLISMTKFGRQLIETATTCFYTVVGVAALVLLLSSLSIMFFGTGTPVNPVGEVVKTVFGILGPFLSLLLGAIFSFGAVLSIYVPLIPYMIFIAGGMGWILATVEAMVAAPIVALGILSPGGQHDILGRGEPAMMLLLNLFLRPSLMVFGLMAGILVSIAIMSMVNAGFLNAMYSINSDPGLFESAFFISIYCTMVITVISKSFSLIYVIPERVLTWIGGPAVQYGEQEMLQGAKQAVEGAAGGISRAGGEAGTAASQGPGAFVKEMRAKNKMQEVEKKQEERDKGISGKGNS